MTKTLIAILIAGTCATTAHAQDLNDRQQAAFDAVLPALSQTLEEQGGETLAAMAPMLANCIVEEAGRRELRKLGDSEIGEEEIALLNEIMARPELQGCVAKAASQ